MTYPETGTSPTPTGPPKMTSTGLFTEEGPAADAVRDRLSAIGMQWFRQCQDERNRQERQWYLNYAFYTGNQHVAIKAVSTSNNFELYVPRAPSWRIRIVINQVRKIIRKEISRLTAQKPNAFVVPASTEDADVFAAQAGEQIWEAVAHRLKFNKVLREAIFWQAVCGVGYIKSYWDPTKIDKDSDTQGDVCLVNVNPFYIFVPDLMCTDLEDQAYVIHAQVRSNSWIKDNFNIDAAPSANTDSIDDAIQSAMGINKNNNKKEQSTILEIWVKPGYISDLPNGGMFMIVANQIVQGFDTWPYDHGQYPFAKLDAMPTGKFYGASIIEDLIPLQQELNRSRAQLIEAKNKMAKPQLMAEKGSVDARKITTEPGQLIEYAIGMNAPQPLPLQNIPSYVTEEIGRLYDDMADVSGQHEVSNGSTPPGVTAATAISFLQEQDESLIATQYTSVEEAVEKVAAQTLWYVKMYWDEEHLVKIVGIEGTFDVQTFKGTDLNGNTDLRVEAGSALPTSRAAKQAFIMDLMKMGFIPPDEGLEMMEVGALDRIYERIQIDKRQAQRENLKMRVVTEPDETQHVQDFAATHPEAMTDPQSGAPLGAPLIVPVNTYDNHDVHIQVHNDYRKSQNFENVDPIVKALFEEHVNQHMEASANMMMHPLTGMQDSNPNAPDPQDEQATMDQMDQQGSGPSSGSGGSPGPVPTPDMSDSSDGGNSQ